MIVIILFVLCFYAPTVAEAPEDKIVLDNIKERPLSILLPLWIPGFRGQFAIGDIEISAESDLVERLFNSDVGIEFYLMGLVRYDWSPWYVRADMFSASLSKSLVFKLDDGTQIDGNISGLVPRIAAGYCLKNWDIQKKYLFATKWDVYGGLRMYGLELKVNLPFEPYCLTSDLTRYHAILGSTVTAYTSKRLKFYLEGDVGASGLEKEFSWFLGVHMNYQLSKIFFINAGWSTLDVSLKKQDSDVTITYDILLTGPIVGIGLQL